MMKPRPSPTVYLLQGNGPGFRLNRTELVLISTGRSTTTKFGNRLRPYESDARLNKNQLKPFEVSSGPRKAPVIRAGAFLLCEPVKPTTDDKSTACLSIEICIAFLQFLGVLDLYSVLLDLHSPQRPGGEAP